MPLLLAAALADPRPTPDVARWTALVQAAERAGLDFVTLEAGPLDPLLLAALLAPQTRTIGLVPVAATTVTEPFHVSTELATIDVAARGRTGWLAAVLGRDEADGQVTWDVPQDVVGDAAEHVEVVRRLWDSWEEGAEIRDRATARFIDRDRVHHVDFRGEHLAVRGPSITPRPPQGHLPIAMRAVDEATARLAAQQADLTLSPDGEAAGRRRFAEVAVGVDEIDGLADRLAELYEAGVDGVLLHADDLPATLERVVPELRASGLRARGTPADATLRARLGLGEAPNRYSAQADASPAAR